MLFPHTVSRRAVLSPASASDLSTVYETLLDTGFESLYGVAGEGGLFAANAAFVVSRRSDGRPVGFSSLHGLHGAGHIRVGTYVMTDRARFGIGSEAVQMTINFAFATYNVDRVLIETTEASFANFGSRTGWHEREGQLRDYVYFRGRPYDLHCFWMGRDEWNEYVDTALRGILAPGRSWREAPQ